ncbi:MAG: diaminopimelate epimerase [Crocinitomicaceae bacterium]
MIDFYKYEGAGNDFVMINNLEGLFEGDKIALAQKLCDRHFGIGSDGLIFIERSDDVDFQMDFYNPDGSQSFCGNGSRCAVAFAHFLNCFKGNETQFSAIDGIHSAAIDGEIVKVGMQNVSEIRKIGEDIYMDTGSPHYIVTVENVSDIDLIDRGKSIRYHSDFEPHGTNVNFVERINTNSIAIRTYERGVENETLACGTGATAAALSHAYRHSIKLGFVEVNAIGGQLKVYFDFNDNVFSNVFLEGPAKLVFKGSIDG